VDSQANKINFNSIKIIHIALIMGVLAFLMFVLFTTNNLTFKSYDGSIYALVVPFVFIIGITVGAFIYKRSISGDTLTSKLQKYQSASIIRAAFLEVPALLAAAITMITANQYYLIYTILSVLMMVFYLPSKSKFANDLDLSLEEKSQLDTY
jgi:hypothetical protein